jgi:WXG100 family type VII secretion target
MPAAKIHVDPDQLKEAAQTFSQQAEAVEKIFNSIKSKYDPLVEGGWIGQGETEYHKEQEEWTHPKLQRLQAALGHSATTVNQISKKFEDGDHEAGQALNPGGFFGFVMGLAASILE